MAPAAPTTRTLADLAEGQSAVVGGFAAALAPHRRQRFEDLGIFAGVEVARDKAAPLGDPLAFRLRGGVLCLRRCEARLILVGAA